MAIPCRARLGTGRISSPRRAQGLSAYGQFFRSVCLDRLSLRFSPSRPSPSGNSTEKSPYRVLRTRLEPVALRQSQAARGVKNFGADKDRERAVHSALRLSQFSNRRLFWPTRHSIVCHGDQTFSFLPPLVKLRATASSAVARLTSCCAPGLFRERNANLFAANHILDSTRRMVDAINGSSKLCADKPRHATGHRLSADDVAQLGKGGDPPLHPLCRLRRHAETVPVSAPSVLRAPVAHIHGAVHP
jgi:hypothetical protein